MASHVFIGFDGEENPHIFDVKIFSQPYSFKRYAYTILFQDTLFLDIKIMK